MTARIIDGKAIAAELRAKVAVNAEGKTRLETLIQQSLDAPLPGTVSHPMSARFRMNQPSSAG